MRPSRLIHSPSTGISYSRCLRLPDRFHRHTLAGAQSQQAGDARVGPDGAEVAVFVLGRWHAQTTRQDHFTILDGQRPQFDFVQGVKLACPMIEVINVVEVVAEVIVPVVTSVALVSLRSTLSVPPLQL
jgi:hypothetical protein